MIQFDYYYIIFFKCFFFSTLQPTNQFRSLIEKPRPRWNLMGSINLQVRVLSARTQFETEQVSSPFEAAAERLKVDVFLKDGPFLKRPRKNPRGLPKRVLACFFFWERGGWKIAESTKEWLEKMGSFVFFAVNDNKLGKIRINFMNFNHFHQMMIFILVHKLHKCKRPRVLRHPNVTKVPNVFQVALCAFCSGSIVPSFVKSNAFLGINTGVPGGSLGKMEKMKVFEKQPFCQEDWSHRWHGFIELSFERCEKSTVYLWVPFVIWMDPNQIRIDRRELVLMHFFFTPTKFLRFFQRRSSPFYFVFFGVKPS